MLPQDDLCIKRVSSGNSKFSAERWVSNKFGKMMGAAFSPQKQVTNSTKHSRLVPCCVNLKRRRRHFTQVSPGVLKETLLFAPLLAYLHSRQAHATDDPPLPPPNCTPPTIDNEVCHRRHDSSAYWDCGCDPPHRQGRGSRRLVQFQNCINCVKHTACLGKEFCVHQRFSYILKGSFSYIE